MASHVFVWQQGPFRPESRRQMRCKFCGAEPLSSSVWIVQAGHWSISDAQKLAKARDYCPEHTDHVYAENLKKDRTAAAVPAAVSCKHCDAGLPVVTITLGDVPIPGMHKVPRGDGLANVVACRNNRHEVPQGALDDAARSPFWSSLKKERP